MTYKRKGTVKVAGGSAFKVCPICQRQRVAECGSAAGGTWYCSDRCKRDGERAKGK